MRKHDDEDYLTLAEVGERYGWKSSTLYYFRELGFLNTYRFVGDRNAYWKASELEAVKNRPPEQTKRGPKPLAVTSLITHTARGRSIRIGELVSPSLTF